MTFEGLFSPYIYIYLLLRLYFDMVYGPYIQGQFYDGGSDFSSSQGREAGRAAPVRLRIL